MDGWNRISERALRFAVGISNDITALHIMSDDDGAPLRKVWAERVEQPARKASAAVPRLEIIHSPCRQVIAPILDFLEKEKRGKPDNAIGVIIPELVETRSWEYLLHSNVTAGLKAMLLRYGGGRVVVISSRWYLHNAPSIHLR